MLCLAIGRPVGVAFLVERLTRNWLEKKSDHPVAGRAIRLVRPTTNYSTSNSLWSADDYDLDAMGLNCPSHNILTWADGTPSYQLEDWSPNGDNMSVRVVTP